MSDQGLKEVIKVDPDAYGVMQNGDKDIKITVEGTGDKKLFTRWFWDYLFNRKFW